LFLDVEEVEKSLATDSVLLALKLLEEGAAVLGGYGSLHARALLI
jgi:hypothetical protein